MNDILKNNLDNIKESTTLFGEKIPQLNVAERIGFVPISIWQPNWTIVKELKDLIGDAGQTRELVGRKMQLLGSKYTSSIFNPHLAQMILSAYCPNNARIYDAFGGGGTRGFIATAMGHRYTGVEIRKEEVDRILKKQDELNLHFEIVCSDSQYYPIQENSYDFAYSCPPYYDLEIYSKIEGDMSNADTYQDFLKMLHKSLEITYRGLKKGALCIWVIGNFRPQKGKGELIHFNGDLVRLGLDIGFSLHDEVIFWGGSNAAAQRAGQFVANRKIVRIHEYLVIFKK